MSKIKFSLLFVTIFLMHTGCMTTHLIAKYDSDLIQSQRTTKVIYLWGILPPRDVLAKCESQSICKIAVKTNLGFILISAATLGIVVPQNVEWDCCPSAVPLERINN